MMTTQLGAGIVAAVGVLLAPGIGAVAGPPHVHAAPASATKSVKKVTADQRMAAMLSVHASAYHAAKMLKPTTQQLRLPTLSAAVSTLSRDHDPAGLSRRRRAIAKLAAFGKGDPATTAAWRTLLGNRPKLAADVQKTVDESGGTPAATESKVFRLLAGSSGCPKEASFSGPLIYGTGVVSVEVQVTVADTIANVAKRIDPQNWDVCGAAFKQTFLTTDSPTPATTCPFPSSFVDPVENDAHPSGSEYMGTLFEDFDCPACGNTRTKNLLTVKTITNKGPCGTTNACAPGTGNPVPYEACFDLSTKPSLGACVGSTPVTLTGDSGSLTACNGATSGDVVVTSRKELKFKEGYANTVTYAMLWLSRAEATQMLVDVVCCPSVP